MDDAGTLLFSRREDRRFVTLRCSVVTDMLDDHRRLGIANDRFHLGDELLRILCVEGKLLGKDPLKDPGRCLAGDICPFCYFAEEVVLHLAHQTSETSASGFGFLLLKFIGLDLLARHRRVLKARDEQLLVDRLNSLVNQLLTVIRNSVGEFRTDFFPTAP